MTGTLAISAVFPSSVWMLAERSGFNDKRTFATARQLKNAERTAVDSCGQVTGNRLAALTGLMENWIRPVASTPASHRTKATRAQEDADPQAYQRCPNWLLGDHCLQPVEPGFIAVGHSSNASLKVGLAGLLSHRFQAFCDRSGTHA